MTSSPRPKRKVRSGVDRSGRTPLHNAVIDQNIALVRELLLTVSNVSAQDDNGWSALHFASASKSIEILSLLIAAGCDVDLVDSHGNTALAKAVFSSQGNGELIQALRSAGASALIANNHGVSPLKLARTIANYPVAQFFSDLA